MVVEGNQARIFVFTKFGEEMSVNAPANAAHIFGDHQINGTALNQGEGLKVIIPLQPFPTALAP